MKMKFKGYKKGKRKIGKGKFTIDKTYESSNINYHVPGIESSAWFKDDKGKEVSENVCHFEY